MREAQPDPSLDLCTEVGELALRHIAEGRLPASVAAETILYYAVGFSITVLHWKIRDVEKAVRGIALEFFRNKKD